VHTEEVEHTEKVVGERKSRFPPWASELAIAAIGNAVGTLTAALILFLGTVVFGAIDDVPTGTILSAATTLLGLVVFLISGVGVARTWPRYRDVRRWHEAADRPVRRARAAFEHAKASLPDEAMFGAKLTLARRALERGDAGEAERLIVELNRHGARPGQPRRARAVSACEEAGVGWAGFHTFRHTVASRLFAAGRNVVQVQRWLGHHSASFTLDTYVHLLDGDLGEPVCLASSGLSPPEESVGALVVHS